MGMLVIAILIVLEIFMVLFIVSLDTTRANMSKVAKIILIAMIICCLMACFIFFNPCQFFHGGFC